MNYLRQILPADATDLNAAPWEQVEAPNMQNALLLGVQYVPSTRLSIWIAEDKPSNRHKKTGHPICVHKFDVEILLKGGSA